jgi:hypothetical protein
MMHAQSLAAIAVHERSVVSNHNLAKEVDPQMLLLPRGSSDGLFSSYPRSIKSSTEPVDQPNDSGHLETLATALPAPPEERFNLKAAFWQTFGENLGFHVWRVATDHTLRWNLAHNPFVHDWFASYKGFDMHRWGDGDTFVVNEVGHPLEGAVFARVFLQNSPDSQVAIGKNSKYWTSRLKATAWAAAWSVALEIGPISETSIGNEGGFNYLPGCGIGPECVDNPKYKKPVTNNTGWTDFVVTPLVGISWVLPKIPSTSTSLHRLP